MVPATPTSGEVGDEATVSLPDQPPARHCASRLSRSTAPFASSTSIARWVRFRDFGGEDEAAAAQALGIGGTLVVGHEQVAQGAPEAAFIGGGGRLRVAVAGVPPWMRTDGRDRPISVTNLSAAVSASARLSNIAVIMRVVGTLLILRCGVYWLLRHGEALHLGALHAAPQRQRYLLLGGFEPQVDLLAQAQAAFDHRSLLRHRHHHHVGILGGPAALR